MTSYFWSGFPSLSGRSDVMYGRRHIGGTDPPALHVTPIGSDSYAIVPPIVYCPTSPRFSSFRFGLVEIARLTSRSYAVARKWVVRSANLRLVVTRKGGIVPRADEIEISFRLDGDTQLCINPGYGVRMHRKLARPSGPARVHFNY